MKIGRIKELINEEIGVSKFTELILERLEIEIIDVDFSKHYQRKPEILVSDALVKKGDIYFGAELFVIFTDKPVKESYYPVYNARIYIDYGENIMFIYLYLHESYKYGNTSKDLFKNDLIRSVIVHELHHFIRSDSMKTNVNNFIDRFEKNNPFLCYLFDIYEIEHKNGKKEIEQRLTEWGQPTQELIFFYYYLSKNELGSVIPEFKYYKQEDVINLFKKINGMPFNEFINYIKNNHNGRTPTNREYKNVQKRVQYFLKKIRKLGVSE